MIPGGASRVRGVGMQATVIVQRRVRHGQQVEVGRLAAVRLRPDAPHVSLLQFSIHATAFAGNACYSLCRK